MKTKTKISKDPYSKAYAFVSGVGGVLTVLAFGITGTAGLLIAGGLTASGYLCGKWQARQDADVIETASEDSAAQVSNYLGRTSDFQRAENRISFDADGMTSLGGSIFGRKIELTRLYESDE